MKIFQQITSEEQIQISLASAQLSTTASYINLFETPVKAVQHVSSPKLQQMYSIKTDIQSTTSGGEDNLYSDEEDSSLFQNHHSNFSNFLDELCGPFTGAQEKEPYNLLSGIHASGSTPCRSFYAPRQGYKGRQSQQEHCSAAYE